MLFNLRALVVSVAVVGLCASTAYAEDVEQEMQEMRDMVLQLQDQLNDQQARLDEQSDRLQEAGLDERGASSGLSSFLEQTDFGGWVAVNYTYNARSHGEGNNHLLDANSTLYHPDSNSFNVDQLWFVMDKDVSAESRAGFHADIAFGTTGNYGTAYNTANGNDAVTVYSAYVSYLAPIGDGLRIDMGEMWTMLGAEVVAAPDNFNITRGLVWNTQPVNNTGLLISYDFGPISTAFGIMNDVVSGTARDTDNNKAITAKLGWANDMFSATGSVIYGSQFDSNPSIPGYTPCVDSVGQAQFDDGGDGVCRDSSKHDLGVLDVLLTADPMDNLSLYLDYTMNWFRPNDGADGYTHGISLAGRWGITDKLGMAIRGEVLLLDMDSSSDLDQAYSLTGTFDYALTDNLMARAEVRWDTVNIVGGSDRVFYSVSDRNDSPSNDDQVLLLAELIYQF